MKNLRFLFFVLLCSLVGFSFTSCGDDEEGISSIVGSWKSSEEVESGYTWYDVLVFNADGTGVDKEYKNGVLNGSSSFTYTLEGNTVTAHYSDDTCTGVLQGNTLTYDGETFTKWNGKTNESQGTETPTESTDKSGTLNGHEYVDLGLTSGTMWATCNVGASSPEGYGDYFAWGETYSKSSYSWGSYSLCYDGNSNDLKRYCPSDSWGHADGLTKLKESDDAARSSWGDGWRMPSEEQVTELLQGGQTSVSRSTKNGVAGVLVKSKTNDNSIFLPYAGDYSTSLSNKGTKGYYWSLTLGSSSPRVARTLELESDWNHISSENRCLGLSVRPVYVP